MNKLTKVGCSALCGSLAAITAAEAGALSVTGGADMTWVSLSKAVTGNPIGMGSNYSLKGSGELDNGWTFDLTIANTNANAFSSAAVNITMGGLGKLNINQGDSGNGIQAYDDKMPTAWEEAHGAGLSTGMRGLVKGVGPSMNIQYTTPTILGTTLAVAWAPRMGDVDNPDKTAGGDTATAGVRDGQDVRININPSLGTEILAGLNIFAGAHQSETVGNNTLDDNAYQGVAGITYDLGPISIGHQWSGEYSGEASATNVYNSYKNHAYGVAFNINDDLSVSYGKMQSYKAGYTNSNVQSGPPDSRRVIVDSFQIAYTMGGASLRVATVEAENSFFGTATNADVSATIVSLGLAF
jgi:hypothetical protein